MSLVFQIPPDSTFYPCEVNLVANFNVPTAGKYDFVIAANTNVLVLPRLKQNYVYLIERLSIGGNVSENIFLNAIENNPVFRLKRLKGGESSQNIFPRGYAVINYMDNQDQVTWFESDKKNDEILLTVNSGLLNQTADLVGVTQIKLNLQYIIYEIRSVGDFKRRFKGPISNNSGRQVMGGE